MPLAEPCLRARRQPTERRPGVLFSCASRPRVRLTPLPLFYCPPPLGARRSPGRGVRLPGSRGPQLPVACRRQLNNRFYKPDIQASLRICIDVSTAYRRGLHGPLQTEVDGSGTHPSTRGVSLQPLRCRSGDHSKLRATLHHAQPRSQCCQIPRHLASSPVSCICMSRANSSTATSYHDARHLGPVICGSRTPRRSQMRHPIRPCTSCYSWGGFL